MKEDESRRRAGLVCQQVDEAVGVDAGTLDIDDEHAREDDEDEP